MNLTGYSLKSQPREKGNAHPVHWVIEGSNDGSTWEILDRKDTQDLNGYSLEKTYLLAHENPEWFQYVRFRHTGRNASGTYNLNLTSIEFFGSVRAQASQVNMNGSKMV